MAAQRHLKNAPIREALIDIQFEPHVSSETLRLFSKAVMPKFDRQSNIWQQTLGFEFTEDNQSKTSTAREALGTRLDSDAVGHVVQARINGFTFSKLAPYKDWEEIRDSAKEIWYEFLKFAKPVVVTRVSVRYINALDIPLPIHDFADYFTALPQIPPTLPQGIGAFLQRVILIEPRTGSVAAITQALEESQPGTQANKVTIFLDIDCFNEKQLTPDSDELWVSLDGLRDFKNAIFFEHITEKTAELFE
jgi:uncharacterized protein (TIGR04255 family)